MIKQTNVYYHIGRTMPTLSIAVQRQIIVGLCATSVVHNSSTNMCINKYSNEFRANENDKDEASEREEQSERQIERER